MTTKDRPSVCIHVALLGCVPACDIVKMFYSLELFYSFPRHKSYKPSIK